jgi:hypothetical protein
MALNLKLTTSARNVIGFERADELPRMPVFIELSAELAGSDIKIRIAVIFQRVTLRAPRGRGPWMAAASDGQLIVQVENGIVADCTATHYVSAEVTEEKSTEKKDDFEIKPEIKLSNAVTVSLVKAGFEKTATVKVTKKFFGRKGNVSVTKYPSRVVWDGLKGLDEDAIGESLAGKINLWADCRWATAERTGTVELRAFYDFYNPDGTPLSKLQSFFVAQVAALRPDLLKREMTLVKFAVEDND